MQRGSGKRVGAISVVCARPSIVGAVLFWVIFAIRVVVVLIVFNMSGRSVIVIVVATRVMVVVVSGAIIIILRLGCWLGGW